MEGELRMEIEMQMNELAGANGPDIRTELPGPLARAVIERDRRVVSSALGRVYPLVVARAEGMYVEDVDGNRFLDMNAGIAVTATGHCHPAVVAAIEAQSRLLLHYCSSDFHVPVYTELCERLAAVAPMADEVNVYLGNSGTEAVEAALKLARYATGRPNVIAFHGSFHGRTAGSLSLTASKSKYRAGFGAAMPGVLHAPYAWADGPNGADYIESILFRHMTEPTDVAAIIVEPIQGEGGYLVPPEGWLADLRRLCDSHGILLIADEVQSGIGRTGTMWAIDPSGVEPDMVCVGKGLASGLPLSAMITRSRWSTWAAGKHGSTFGGNPVACAAAVATLDLVEDNLIANASAVGSRLLDRLRALATEQSIITDVRGRGLMIGVEFVDGDTAHRVEQAAFSGGMLVLTCGERSVRMAPPLVIDSAQADLAVELFSRACKMATENG